MGAIRHCERPFLPFAMRNGSSNLSVKVYHCQIAFVPVLWITSRSRKRRTTRALNLARVPEQIRKDLWAHVKTLNLYDCMNVLCSVPSLRRKFFKSFERDIGGVVHSVIGVDAHDACVPNPASVREYLSEMLLKGIAAYRPNDGAAYPLVLVSDPGQDLDDEMAFIMLRTLELNGWFRLEARDKLTSRRRACEAGARTLVELDGPKSKQTGLWPSV